MPFAILTGSNPPLQQLNRYGNVPHIVRRVFVVIILLAFSPFIPASAQNSSPPKGQISAAEILDRHATAVGGLEALRSIQTLVVHGRAGYPGAQDSAHLNDFSFYYKSPSDDLFEFDMVSEGESFAGQTEAGKFFRHDGRGPLTINGVSMDALEECWRALIEWNLAGRYSHIDLVGLSQIDGRWAYALRFTPSKGDPFVRYYDSESYLMVQMNQVQRLRVDKGGLPYAYKVTAVFTDYRDFDGLKLPERIIANASDTDVGLLLNSVHKNVPVDDSKFKRH